jgi:ABC-type branched-subunit amino acid transport system ATPase component
MDDEEEARPSAREELARILRESADRIAGNPDAEQAQQRAAEFARRLRTDPTIIFNSEDKPTS